MRKQHNKLDAINQVGTMRRAPQEHTGNTAKPCGKGKHTCKSKLISLYCDSSTPGQVVFPELDLDAVYAELAPRVLYLGSTLLYRSSRIIPAGQACCLRARAPLSQTGDMLKKALLSSISYYAE